MFNPIRRRPRLLGVNQPHAHLHPTRRKKVFAALLLLVPALVFILIIALFLGRREKPKEELTIERRRQERILEGGEGALTRWAKDPEVVSLEGELERLRDEAGPQDIENPQLLPPLLDFDVNFEE